MRHSSELIQKIKYLRNNGATLGEIVATTGLSKSTIHWHIGKVTKSDYLISRLREIARRNQEKIANLRRGKSIKTYVFIKPRKWTPDFVMLVAHFMFDGEISRTSCIYNNRSHTLLRRMIRLMREIIGVGDYKYLIKPDGVQRVSYFHVEIAAFIKQKSIELLQYIQSAPDSHKIAFLRAFFDDEGSMRLQKSKRAVRGYQHSRERLLLVQKLLADFGIESFIGKRYVEITISRRPNLLEFQKLINFSEGVSINPDRSNSIWKRPLQKREILQMALDSYQAKPLSTLRSFS